MRAIVVREFGGPDQLKLEEVAAAIRPALPYTPGADAAGVVDAVGADVTGIGAGLRTGVLSPVVGREMPLANAAEAHSLVMAPGARGKIVLIPA